MSARQLPDRKDVMSISDRLDQIEQRVDAATEGPWEARILSPYKGGTVYEPSGYPLPGCSNCGENEATYEEEDAEFIAHARTDVPDLVSALRAVLDVCETYPVPPRDKDVTGDVLAGMEKLERLVRAAIHDALGEEA